MEWTDFFIVSSLDDSKENKFSGPRSPFFEVKGISDPTLERVIILTLLLY